MNTNNTAGYAYVPPSHGCPNCPHCNPPKCPCCGRPYVQTYPWPSGAVWTNAANPADAEGGEKV